MRVFDSGVSLRWSGKGIKIRAGMLVTVKNAQAEQSFQMEEGKYNFKILGRKRTGNGKFKVKIHGDTAKGQIIYLDETIIFSKRSWSEYSFDFEVGSKLKSATVSFSRAGSFGTVEIGRAVVTQISKKEDEIKERSSVKNKNVPIKKRIEVMDVESISFKNSFKKKITFIVPYGIFGGGEIYIGNLIKNINKEFYDVTILSLAPNQLTAYLERDAVTHRVCRNIEQMSGYLISFPSDYIVYYNRADIYEKLVDLVSKKEIGPKLIEIYHSDFKWQGSLSHLRSRKCTDLLIRVADDLAEDIVGVRDDNIFTLPVGINLEEFSKRDNIRLKETLQLKKPVIGTVARLSKEKNIDYILDLSVYMKEFQFVIVGSGPEEKRLRQRKEKEGLSNVIFLGFKRNISEYYNIFDAFVLASDIEGTPISILEAMASGVPVFTNMVGSIPSIVKDGLTGHKITGNFKADAKLILEKYSDNEVKMYARNHVENNHNILNNTELFLRELFKIENFYIKRSKDIQGIVLKGEFY